MVRFRDQKGNSGEDVLQAEKHKLLTQMTGHQVAGE